MGMVIPWPWRAPEEGSAHVLQGWASGLFPDELVESPLVVATCSHCAEVVLALGPGHWALVEVTEPIAGAKSWRIRRMSSLTAVAAAMRVHAAAIEAPGHDPGRPFQDVRRWCGGLTTPDHEP